MRILRSLLISILIIILVAGSTYALVNKVFPCQVNILPGDTVELFYDEDLQDGISGFNLTEASRYSWVWRETWILNTSDEEVNISLNSLSTVIPVKLYLEVDNVKTEVDPLLLNPAEKAHIWIAWIIPPDAPTGLHEFDIEFLVEVNQ